MSCLQYQWLFLLYSPIKKQYILNNRFVAYLSTFNNLLIEKRINSAVDSFTDKAWLLLYRQYSAGCFYTFHVIAGSCSTKNKQCLLLTGIFRLYGCMSSKFHLVFPLLVSCGLPSSGHTYFYVDNVLLDNVGCLILLTTYLLTYLLNPLRAFVHIRLWVV